MTRIVSKRNLLNAKKMMKKGTVLKKRVVTLQALKNANVRMMGKKYYISYTHQYLDASMTTPTLEKIIIKAESKMKALNKFLKEYNNPSYEYIIHFIERIR